MVLPVFPNYTRQENRDLEHSESRFPFIVFVELSPTLYSRILLFLFAFRLFLAGFLAIVVVEDMFARAIYYSFTTTNIIPSFRPATYVVEVPPLCMRLSIKSGSWAMKR